MDGRRREARTVCPGLDGSATARRHQPKQGASRQAGHGKPSALAQGKGSRGRSRRGRLREAPYRRIASRRRRHAIARKAGTVEARQAWRALAYEQSLAQATLGSPGMAGEQRRVIARKSWQGRQREARETSRDAVARGTVQARRGKTGWCG